MHMWNDSGLFGSEVDALITMYAKCGDFSSARKVGMPRLHLLECYD